MPVESVQSTAANTIGTLAGSLTTLSFLPQVIAVYRRRSARDLSYGYLLTFATGVVCWLLYGVIIAAVPVILTNAVTLTLVLVIVAQKITFERAANRP